MKKYKKKITLKVNENNDIDSIIELFQRFGKKYNIITTTLPHNIQYETKNIKITQTYTTTIEKTELNKMITKLQKEDKIALIIIDNQKKKNNTLVNDKIKKLKSLENVKIRKIKEKDTFKTLDNIIKEA
ncbi:MAG: hypothetical protein BZ135_07210 [Methanosphaera sp. rholeuAM6]|nr:MAG: hypothetical protein BZ135_07210 [Methanosphaera sp. rholeuAM6]